jgi:hypothetical protein
LLNLKCIIIKKFIYYINNRQEVSNIRNRTILFILIPILIIGSVAAYTLFNYESAVKSGTWENHQLLFILIDDTEPQGGGGPGAVDMAFVANFTNATVENITPIYPGDMAPSTNISAPPDVPNESNLRLVDSFYWSNLTQDSQYAQQIVQSNTGIQTDGVMIIKPEAVDAIDNAVGPIYVNGTPIGGSSLTYVRMLQHSDNQSRGDSVLTLFHAIVNASSTSKLPSLISTINSQNSQGNIETIPSGLIGQLITEEGANKLFGL